MLNWSSTILLTVGTKLKRADESENGKVTAKTIKNPQNGFLTTALNPNFIIVLKRSELRITYRPLTVFGAFDFIAVAGVILSMDRTPRNTAEILVTRANIREIILVFQYI